MHLFGQRILGIAILLLLAFLVAIKRLATASVVDWPRGHPVTRVVNTFNLLFLLVVNPVTAVLLILRRLPGIDPTHINVPEYPVLAVLESLGLLLYVCGFALMAWALMRLRRDYQPGGSAPRPGSSLDTGGPYRLVRHPMYAAALCISLGLALLVQSGLLLLVLLLYLGLILLLIPLEESGLRVAFGEPYAEYRRVVRKLVPFVY